MKQRNQRERETQLRNDYAALFSSEQGKRVLEDILTYCHVVEPLLGSIDTNSIIIREAKRDVAITILQKMNWKTEDFINLVEK